MLLQAADLLAINAWLTGDIDAGYNWVAIRDAIARHRGEVEFYPGLHEKAAALLDSLIRTQPFSHANNQTAVMAIDVLYALNGMELDLPSSEMLEYIETGSITGQASMAVFLGRHVRERY